MKELLLEYAQYNVWANNLIIEALLKLDNGVVDKEITSSFPSLRATVCHTWSAEYIWFQRLQLATQPLWIESSFKGTFEEACQGWQMVSEALSQFTVNQSGNNSFTDMLLFEDRSKVSHQMPVYQVLLHVFNHTTYHRGQLVTMLRQVGVAKMPGMDFILFARKKE
jgi:uncharacterized damage-inducible protein DinB